MFTKQHALRKAVCGVSSDKLSDSCSDKNSTSNEPRLSDFLLGFPLTSSRRDVRVGWAEVSGHCLTCTVSTWPRYAFQLVC